MDIEFVDSVGLIVIDNVNGGINVGGWPVSSVRTFVNSTVFDHLPMIIQNAIIDTTVVSGHGPTEGETNFTSIDKMYLLSTHEVFEDVNGLMSSRDTAYGNTRQLDYYKGLNVTTSNYNGAIKNISWWLRSVTSFSVSYFFIVKNTGNLSQDYVSSSCGVSPAFRIG